jgi:diaminohydroxyphosphoribosylaminopyrimidine deaminase / 5-amino-6-(5-phosphoribosylamino)uracil reductase
VTAFDWGPLMRRALELAELGRYGTSPNPMVGTVVLDRAGAVAGEGAHLRCGGPHAEVFALRAAGERARGGTVVVTLEPCSVHGRTPPCVDALLAAGVARVVFAVRDPNPRVDGGGAAALRVAGVEVVEGVEAEAAGRLIRRFAHWQRTRLPWVTLKVGMTADGKLAARGGRGQRVTGDAARRSAYALREEHDAVLVGVGTILADDPRLTRRLGLNPESRVRRVVLDSRLRTPRSAALLAERPEDVLLFHCDGAADSRRQRLARAGAQLVQVEAEAGRRCDLHAVLRALSGQGISSVLVEGGGEVHFAFLRERLAQALVAYVAPVVLGGREAVPAVGGSGFASPAEGARLRFERVERLGEDIVLNAEIVGV